MAGYTVSTSMVNLIEDVRRDENIRKIWSTPINDGEIEIITNVLDSNDLLAHKQWIRHLLLMAVAQRENNV